MPEVFRCRRCGFRSVRPFRFLGHLLRHAAQDKLSRCSRCQRKLFSPRHKRLHRLRCLRTKRRPAERPRSPKTEDDEDRKEDAKVLSCPRCPYVTSGGAYALANHLRRAKACDRQRKMASFVRVEADQDGKYPCSRCSYRGKDLVALNHHLRAPKACQRQRLIDSYVKVEPGDDGRFPCAKCSYKGPDLAAINKHMRSPVACSRRRSTDSGVQVERSQDGKFHCPRCPYAVSHISNLTQHLQFKSACDRRNQAPEQKPRKAKTEDGVLFRNRSVCPGAGCGHRWIDEERWEEHEASCLRLRAARHRDELFPQGSLCEDCGTRPHSHDAAALRHFYSKTLCALAKVAREIVERGGSSCPSCGTDMKACSFGKEPRSLAGALVQHWRGRLACSGSLVPPKDHVFACVQCSAELSSEAKLAKHSASKLGCEMVKSGFLDQSPLLKATTITCDNCGVELPRQSLKNHHCIQQSCRGSLFTSSECQGCGGECEDAESLRAHENACPVALKRRHLEELVSAADRLCPDCGLKPRGLWSHLYVPGVCAVHIRASELVRTGSSACPDCDFDAADEIAGKKQWRTPVARLAQHWLAGHCKQVLQALQSTFVSCDGCGAEFDGSKKLALHMEFQLGCAAVQAGALSQLEARAVHIKPRMLASPKVQGSCAGCEFVPDEPGELSTHEEDCEPALVLRHEAELFGDGVCECGYDPLGKGQRNSLGHFYERDKCLLYRSAMEMANDANGASAVCTLCAFTADRGKGGSQAGQLTEHFRRSACRAALIRARPIQAFECAGCGVVLSSAWKLDAHEKSRLGCRLVRSGAVERRLLTSSSDSRVTCDSCSALLPLKHFASHSCVQQVLRASLRKLGRATATSWDNSPSGTARSRACTPFEGHPQSTTAEPSTMSCSGLECNFADESKEAVALHEAGCVGVLAQRHWAELFPDGPVDCAQCSRPACVRKLFHLQHLYSAKACRAARLARDVVERSGSETCPECPSSFVVGDEPSSRGTIRLIAHFTLTACGRALAAREPDPAKCTDCGAEMEGEEKLAVHRASELGCRLVASGVLTVYRLDTIGACDDCHETLPFKGLTGHSCIQKQRKKQRMSGRTAMKQEELPKPALKPLSCQGLECNYAVESEEEVALHEAGCVGVLAQRHWDELFPDGPTECSQCFRPASTRPLRHLQHFYNPVLCRMARVASTVFQGSEEPCCPFCEKPFRGHESERLFRHLTTSLCGRELMSQEDPPEQCPDCGAEAEGREALAKHRASAFGCRLITTGALAPQALRPDATCDTCLREVSAKALPTHACVKLARCEYTPKMANKRRVPAPIEKAQHAGPEPQCSGMECKFAGESEEEVKLHEASCAGVLAQQHWTELFGDSSGECAQCSRSLSTRRRLQLKHFYNPILCRMAKVARDLLADSEEATCPECSTLFTLGNATKTSVESSVIAHLSSSLCGRALMAQAEEPPQCLDCGAAVEGEASLARHRASTVACRLISSGFLGKRVEAPQRPDASPPPAKCSGLECDFAEDGPEAVQRHEASCLGVLARRHWEELFPEGARDCGDCARPPSVRRLLQLQHFYTPSICRAARVVGEALRTPGRAACPLCDASLEGAERMALSHLTKGACMRALAEREGPPLECSSCGAKVEGGAKLRKHLDSSLGCRLIASGFLDSREAKGQSVVCDSCSQILTFKALKSHPCIGQALRKTPVKRLKAERPETGREAFDCSGCMRTFKGRQSIVRHHCDKLQPLSLLTQRASAALLGSGRKCPLCRLRAPATATHAAKLRHIASAKCRQRSALAKLFVQADASVSCPSCGAPAESPSALESHFSSSQPCRKAFVDSLWADGKRSCGCGFASASAEALALHAASELACEAQRRGLFRASSEALH